MFSALVVGPSEGESFFINNIYLGNNIKAPEQK